MDTSYFNKIDSKTKAYLLGFLFADGSVTTPVNRQMRLSCYQHIRAEEIIYKLQAEIRDDQKGISFITSRNQKAFYISSNELCNDLISHGLIPGKSKKELNMPNLEYKWDFIKGFFDGDGTVGKYGNCRQLSFVCFSKNFLHDIQSEMDKLNIKSTLYSEKTYWRLRVTNIAGLQIIYDKFYTDSKFHIAYKKSRFDNVVKIPR